MGFLNMSTDSFQQPAGQHVPVNEPAQPPAHAALADNTADEQQVTSPHTWSQQASGLIALDDTDEEDEDLLEVFDVPGVHNSYITEQGEVVCHTVCRLSMWLILTFFGFSRRCDS